MKVTISTYAIILLSALSHPSVAEDCKKDIIVGVGKRGVYIITGSGQKFRPIAQDFIDSTQWKSDDVLFVCAYSGNTLEKNNIYFDIFDFRRSERLPVTIDLGSNNEK
jgi:hypothetical protein